jgi:hypothetical protein
MKDEARRVASRQDQPTVPDGPSRAPALPDASVPAPGIPTPRPDGPPAGSTTDSETDWDLVVRRIPDTTPIVTVTRGGITRAVQVSSAMPPGTGPALVSPPAGTPVPLSPPAPPDDHAPIGSIPTGTTVPAATAETGEDDDPPGQAAGDAAAGHRTGAGST